MNDSKSKLPDLKEICAMAEKLLKDLKTSVTQIIHNYKQKRPHAEGTVKHKATTTKPKTSTAKAKPAKTAKTAKSAKAAKTAKSAKDKTEG